METEIEARKAGREVLRRALTLQEKTIDAETRTVRVAVSSEEPYERYFGTEILDHTSQSINADFLASGRAPLLLDHDPTKQIGVVEEITLDSEARRLRANVRFGKSELAEEIFQDVVDGIRSNISVGYYVTKMVLEKNDKETGEVYRVTDWTPIEVSLVSIPADPTVGVGRSAETKETDVSEKQKPKIEVKKMTEQTQAAEQVDVSAVLAARNKEVAEINALAAKHNRRDLADEALKSGKSLPEFRGMLLDAIGNKPLESEPAKLGLSKKEKERFSLMKAVWAMADGRRDQAGYEFEVSEEIAKRMGKEARGIYLPQDIMTRDLTVGSPTAGGNLVEDKFLASEYVEALRAAQAIGSLGTRYLTGLKGDVVIPAANAATSAYFVAEGSAPTEGAPTYRQITMTPKTCGAFVDISRKLRLQSTPDIEMLIRDDLVKSIALKVEEVAIEGGASHEPTGLLANSNINAVTIGSNGGAPTWATVVNLVKEVEADNVILSSPAYLMNSKVKAKLAQTAKVSSTDSKMILDAPFTDIYGYRYAVTNNVPSDLTKGVGSNLSALIFGEFSNLLLGFWSGIDLIVDTATFSSSGGLRLVAFQDVDVAVRHAQAFASCEEIVTT